MHASQEALRVAKKFVKGEAAQSPLVEIMGQGKGRRINTDGQTVFSYCWFPIAERTQAMTIEIKEEKYQTGSWRSGKPKYSPTTESQKGAVRDALQFAGWRRDEDAEGEHWFPPTKG